MTTRNPLPTVSVVMATFNGELYLEEQLDSILSQSLQPAEILVCDDRSLDNTVSILDKYSRKGYLKYVVNETQLGLIANFKKGVALTSERGYIALSDQDDIWLPNKLELSAEKLRSIDDSIHPTIVYSDLILIDKNKSVLNTSFRNELGQDVYKHSLRTLLFGNFVNGCTVLMNEKMKQFFATIPDNVTLNHDAWIALIAFTFGKVDVVSGSLIKYRKHENNVTGVSTLEKMNRYQRIKSQVSAVFTQQPSFLFEQLTLVQEFYDTFESYFSAEHKSLIQRFLKLKKRSYLHQKFAMRLFFKGHWL
jgi:glycosyltransferase involved in cell wall biosynthesis